MQEFLHDILHILGDMKIAVETAMKKLEDLATKKALEDAEKYKRKKDDKNN